MNMSDIGTRLDWIGAVWLTLLAFSWFFRWHSKIPGRFISVSGWLIIVNGLLALRWPRIFGVNTPVEIEYSTRFIIYVISTWLHVSDWQIYRGLTPAEKAKILDALLLLKKKKKVKQAAFVKRADYDLLVKQLESLKREDENKQDGPS